jgi:hypothetical protein
MINKIYKIVFNNDVDILNELYDRLSEHDKEKISELDCVSYFDYIEDNKYFLHVITTEIEIDKYTSVLESNLIKFRIFDISNHLLTNKINLFSLESKIDKNDIIKFEFFMDDVKDWLLNNLNINIILDRISEVGMDNLSKIEKDFLNNYKV